MRIDEFLLARIAEDEAVAREAFALRKEWEAFRMVTADPDPDLGVWADSEHVAMGVERMLAECEAKRAIVAAAQNAEWCADNVALSPGYLLGQAHAYRHVLRALATVYADHPDYQPEWAG